jgi:hypothetical protein
LIGKYGRNSGTKATAVVAKQQAVAIAIFLMVIVMKIVKSRIPECNSCKETLCEGHTVCMCVVESSSTRKNPIFPR